MTTAAIFHDAAMEYYDLGKIAKAKENTDIYKDYLQKAYVLSKEAALKGQADITDTFWKYVYTRSAAYLAMECGKLEEARKLAHIGLAGTPPEPEATQLKDALEQIESKIPDVITSHSEPIISVSGTLLSVDLEECLIKVRQIGTDEYHTFKVPTEYMEDVARLYLGGIVKVNLIPSDNEPFLLKNIQLAA